MKKRDNKDSEKFTREPACFKKNIIEVLELALTKPRFESTGSQEAEQNQI